MDGILAFLYCYKEKTALTIRFVKKLTNGNYLVVEEELIQYNPTLTTNGQMILLLKEFYYSLIEPGALIVNYVGA